MTDRDFTGGTILLINKPLKWTSFQVVNKLKFAIGRHLKHSVVIASPANKSGKLKIGHAGTLDPLATGLLIICTGKMTKQIEQIQQLEKEYTGRFFIGATTPCFDLEKEPDTFFDTGHITADMIRKTAEQFKGTILQLPPAHSAVKIDGKRAYELARQGKEFEIKPKSVTIYEFEITAIEMPYVDFRVVCSKGTYIRSLANDFGRALGSGAYLAQLCRTRTGSYKLAEALSPDEVIHLLENQQA